MLSPERIETLPLHVVALLGQVWSRVKELADVPRDYYGVEMGQHAVITNEVELMGFPFEFVDQIPACREDNTDFVDAICEHIIKPIMSVRTRGLAWFSISPEGWSAGRTREKPFGDLTTEKYCIANAQMAILCIAIVLSWLRGIYFVIEHPCTSWLTRVGPLQDFLVLIEQHIPLVMTNWQAFGSHKSKPRKLWGTWKTANELWRQPKPRSSSPSRPLPPLDRTDRPTGLGNAVAKAFKVEASKMRSDRFEAPIHFNAVIDLIDAKIAQLPVSWGETNHLMDIVGKICTGFTSPVVQVSALADTDDDSTQDMHAGQWALALCASIDLAAPAATVAPASSSAPAMSTRDQAPPPKKHRASRIPTRYHASIKYFVAGWERVLHDRLGPNIDVQNSECEIKLKCSQEDSSFGEW